MPLLDNKSTSTVSSLRPLLSYVKAQSENEKFLKSIELGATFMLISFFLIFAIRPTASAISTLLGDIKSKELLATQLKNKINQVIKAQDAFAQIQENYIIVNDSLPDRPEFFNSANMIASVMASQNIQPKAFDFNFNDSTNIGSSINPNLKGYTVSVPMDVSFVQGKEIIYGLIKDRRIVSLPSFTFRLSQDVPSAPLTPKLDLDSVFYYWDSNE